MDLNNYVEKFFENNNNKRAVRSENANIRDTIALLNTRLGSDNNIRYALQNSPAGSLHSSGEVYLHNLTESVFLPHCISYDVLQLIKEGFRGLSVRSRPPKRFSSLLGQCLSLLSNAGTVTSGAQSLSYLPMYAAPFLWYIKYSDHEIYQALEEFVYALNSAVMRASFQNLFANITLNFDIPKEMADVPVIWNGEVQKDSYGDFQEELDRFNYLYLKVMERGYADGSMFTFPILTIYSNDSVFKPDEKYPVREQLWNLTAKYSLPNFLNKRGNKDQFSKLALCCHLSLDTNSNQKTAGGIWDIGNGMLGTVGAVQVVTINIALGAMMNKTESQFDDWLTRVLNLSDQHINFCRQQVKKARNYGLLPVLDHYMGSLENNFFNVIGVAGFEEATIHLFGEGLTSKSSQDWTIKKLELLKNLLKDLELKDGILRGIEAPPLENAKGFLARKILAKFPEAKLQGIPNPFISTGCNFSLENENLPEEIQWRSRTDPLFSSGNIHFTNVFEEISPDSAKRFIDRLTKKTDISYECINLTICICEDHGLFYGRIDYCPICKHQLRKFTRVVGYFQDIRNFSPHNYNHFWNRKNSKIN